MKTSQTRPFVLFLLIASCIQSQATQPATQELACAKAGESAGGSCVGCKICCAGFIVADTWVHKNYKTLGCEAPSPPGSSGVCVKCGDGKCDTANSENLCNCPKDCS